VSRYDWMADARCAQVDPDLWHQDGSGDNYAAAKRICQRCPVRPQCEAYTDRLDADTHSRHGMWAARTKSQREAARARAGREARHAAILRLIERGGMETHEIAEHVGCSERTVWRALANHRDQTTQPELAAGVTG
jgi:WhiB family redox-sensing transcriptional regulator